MCARRASRRRQGLLRPLRRVLRAGAAGLSPPARAGLLPALRETWLPAGPARGRDGGPDLRRTLLALWLSDALDAPFGRQRLKDALEGIMPREPDVLHRACRVCLLARIGAAGPRSRLDVLRDAFGATLARRAEPRVLFAWALAAESCGWRPPWYLLAWWAPWNWSTTPRAAAVLSLQALAGSAFRRGRQAQLWLLDQRMAEGGFRAGAEASGADLLSTAAARFALHLAGCAEESHDALALVSFVERCQGGSGHWRSRPDDPDEGDVAHSFHALLALGAAGGQSHSAPSTASP
jgi:hypothetical protein